MGRKLYAGQLTKDEQQEYLINSQQLSLMNSAWEEANRQVREQIPFSEWTAAERAQTFQDAMVTLGGLGAAGAVGNVRSRERGTGEVAPDAGSVKGVNPTGSTQNCTNCVAVVDNLLTTGNPASALPRATPVPFDQLGKMYGTTFSGWRTQKSIESSLLAGGNGTRAVIYGTDGTTGHVWNAVVQNGRVNYIDGQTGASGAANFQSFSHFQFGVLP